MPDSVRISISNLSVRAPDRLLLSGINLEMAPGEIVAIAGPSGLGKSRFLRAVCGLDDPESGEVRLEGRTAQEVGWPAFRRRTLLLQQRPVLTAGTVMENLRHPFQYQSSKGKFPEHEAQALLTRLLIVEKDWQQEARTLSIGQQQRVALVRALILRPDVLLLDEPTSALDRDAVAMAEALLTELCSANRMSILLVTHDREQAARLGARIVDLAAYAASMKEVHS